MRNELSGGVKEEDDWLAPHSTLIAAYEGSVEPSSVGRVGKGEGGRRLTVEKGALEEALRMLDRAGGL